MKLIKNTLFIAFAALAFTACKKTVGTEPLNDAGQTLVKFVFADGSKNPNGIPDTANGKYAGYQLFNIDLVPTPQTLEVFDLRRDVPNNTELNRPMTIIVQTDPGAVTAYDAGLVPIPNDSYLPDPSYPLTGLDYTITMAAGELAKTLKVTIPDITSLDLSKRYGLGFTITAVDADGHISAMQKTIVIEVGTKNQWDGVYENTFTNYHPTLNSTFQGGVAEIELVTTSSNTDKMYWPDAGAFGCPANLGAANLQFFGSQEPEFTINKTTNAVTVQNSFSGAVTFYNMAAGFNSRYDPASKTFYVKWGYNNPGGVFDPAATREWTQTLKYIRAR